MELKRRLENGMLSSSVRAEMANQIASGGGQQQQQSTANARMCQDKSDSSNTASLHKIDSKSSIANRNVTSSPSVMSLSPFSASITQLPPPEFADFPSDQSQQLPVSAVAAASSSTVTSLSTSNGRASMISSSFRPTAPANSSCSTLPRNLPSSYNNEHPMTSSALLASQQQQQHQRCSSLKKKTSMKRVPSPIGSGVDELRV